MYGILMAYGSSNSKNPAVKFLFKLYGTHRGIISPDKDYLEPVPGNSMTNVLWANINLDAAILAAYASRLPKLYQLPTSSIPIVKEYKDPNNIFPTWLVRTTHTVKMQKLRKALRPTVPLYLMYGCPQKHK